MSCRDRPLVRYKCGATGRANQVGGQKHINVAVAVIACLLRPSVDLYGICRLGFVPNYRDPTVHYALVLLLAGLQLPFSPLDAAVPQTCHSQSSAV